MSWRSVRFRLTLWNVAVLGLVLAVYAVTLAWTVPASLAVAADRDLEERAHRVARWWSRIETSPEAGAGGGQFWLPWLDRMAGDDQEREGRENSPLGTSEAERRGYFRRPRLLGLDGEALVPGTGDVPWDSDTYLVSQGGQKVFSTIRIDQELLRVYSMPLWQGGTEEGTGTIEGVVQVAHPLSEQRRLASALIRYPLALIPVALVVAAMGGIFLTHRALAPVRQVTQTAAQITAEDLSRRLEVKGKDELAELAETFNGMIARLEGAFSSLEEAYTQLGAAYEQQRRFTGDASHELRTPLTRIKGSASLALSRERTPAEYQNSLRVINQAADSMNEIVQDLLLLARADSGQLAAQARLVSLPDVMAAAVSEAPSDGAEIVLHAEPGLPPVKGEPGQLRRLFLNLLENAVRHTPPEGRVEISARNGGGQITVTVQDTGEGIPPEHLPHVCDRFYRVDAARSRASGGTGLGLAICQTIAQAHGGTLSLDSEVGVGTCVTVTLPVALPSATDENRA